MTTPSIPFNRRDMGAIVVDKIDTVVAYPSGTGVVTAYSYTAPDEILRRFVGTLNFTANITAGKKMTVVITENVGGVTDIDSKEYTVGTDPDPHFDFESFGSITVTIQIDITEGASKDVPRAITVQNAL